MSLAPTSASPRRTHHALIVLDPVKGRKQPHPLGTGMQGHARIIQPQVPKTHKTASHAVPLGPPKSPSLPRRRTR